MWEPIPPRTSKGWETFQNQVGPRDTGPTVSPSYDPFPFYLRVVYRPSYTRTDLTWMSGSIRLLMLKRMRLIDIAYEQHEALIKLCEDVLDPDGQNHVHDNVPVEPPAVEPITMTLTGPRPLRVVVPEPAPSTSNIDVPKGRIPAYVKFVCAYKPHKSDPHWVRMEVGGNIVDYPGEVATRTSDLPVTKAIINSVISNEDSLCMNMDINN
jgi:hypothetical protein